MASGVALKAHSDASYLSESLSRIIVGVFFYLGGTNEYNNQPNGVIMVISIIMRNVISSAAEA